MVLNDVLANGLSKILNAEKIGQPICRIKPVGNLLKNVLAVLHEEGYLGDINSIDDGKAGILEVHLLHRINKCGAIKPRFPVSHHDYEKFEKRYLIARGFGVILVSTSAGLMIHTQAKEKGLGGKLIAYCY